MNDSEIVLYILMRTDMASLTPGKACAQAAHAANAAVYSIKGSHLDTYFQQWKGQGGFGTTVVLAGGPLSYIESACGEAKEKLHCYAALVIDPMYPIKDGETMHKVPVVTCGWAFGERRELTKIFRYLPLY